VTAVPAVVRDAARDPELAALASAALACEWDPIHGYDHMTCPAMEAWLAHGRGAALDEDTLVDMLEDRDEHRRHLAAEKLHAGGVRYRTDRALAGRVVRVAERESVAPVVFPLGYVVSDIDLAATRTADGVRTLVTAHPDHIMRAHVVGGVVTANPRSEEAFAIAKAGFADDDWLVRASALDEIVAATNHVDEACTLALSAVPKGDPDVASAAMRAIDQHHTCDGRPGDVIAAIGERVANKRLRFDFNAGLDLQNACASPKATSQDKSRAAAIGRTMVAQDDLADFRGAALYAVFACDPHTGRVLASTLLHDHDVAQAAKDILAR